MPLFRILCDLETAEIVWGWAADGADVILAALRDIAFGKPNVEVFAVQAHCV